jgi:hypothetical protein
LFAFVLVGKHALEVFDLMRTTETFETRHYYIWNKKLI